MRTVALSLILLMTVGAHVAHGGSSKGDLRVYANAVESLSLEELKEPRYFEVSREMVKRGSRLSKDKDDDDGRSEGRQHSKRDKNDVTVKKEISILVTTNSSGGYALVIQAADIGVYTAARIKIRGYGEVRLRAGESTQVPVRNERGKRDVRRLEVTLIVSKDAKPGKYPWPINVSAIPL